MTETLLALVPTYGVWLVFASLLLSCLAIPAPSSILVMAAGAFAASGDLLLWQVQAAAFAGFVIGDQTAYVAARHGGGRLIAWAKARPALGGAVTQAETLLHRHGMLGVFLSRTLFSPLGPYIGYLSGALQLRWFHFTAPAVAGAICWCLGYTLLGYVFATRVAQLAGLLGNATGLILSGAVVIGLAWYLATRWRTHDADPTLSRSSRR